MTRDIQTCTPRATLTQVAKLMWEGCCGIVPVVDARGRVAGVVTDRDISMALVSSARKPINIAAHEIMTHTVHACAPEDDVHAALQAMKQFKVRRLPVISKEGQLRGILSIDDVIVRALAPDAPTSGEIVESLREILKGLQGQPVSVA
jgi:CBS domain-containing protein